MSVCSSIYIYIAEGNELPSDGLDSNTSGTLNMSS